MHDVSLPLEQDVGHPFELPIKRHVQGPAQVESAGSARRPSRVNGQTLADRISYSSRKKRPDWGFGSKYVAFAGISSWRSAASTN
jgi:hypothetical protein